MYTALMTISNRNRIILVGIVFIFVLLVISIIMIFFIIQSDNLEHLQSDIQFNIFVFIAAIIAELIFCLTTTLALYFSFRKTTSPEIFFFIIFIVAMSIDSLKSVQIIINISRLSPYFGMIITRIIYYGKFLGTLSLFSAGLFSTGVEYQRTEIVLGIGLLLAFVLAATVPVDMTELKANLVHALGKDLELLIISVLFQTFALLSFVFAGIQNSNPSYFSIAAGVGIVMVGRHLIFYRTDLISVLIAFVFLAGGSILFSERTRKIHLWL